MDESQIAELCRRIYRKHQRALDLIYEYRPDLQEEIRHLLETLIKEKEAVDAQITDQEAKIASYPWGFYKEPAKRLVLSIESLSLVDGQIILKARYYASNNKSKIIYFEKHLALTSSYEKALFVVLDMLYGDIAKYIDI